MTTKWVVLVHCFESDSIYVDSITTSLKCAAKRSADLQKTDPEKTAFSAEFQPVRKIEKMYAPDDEKEVSFDDNVL